MSNQQPQHIIVSTESEGFLTNSYLIGDKPGGKAVLVDSNGVAGPLIEAAREFGLTIERILLTHHHYDHVVDLQADSKAAGTVPICGLADTAKLVPEVTETFADGDLIRVGSLQLEVVHTPGHCDDHAAFMVIPEGRGVSEVLSADVLFAGTVGGTVFGGPDGFSKLKDSVMNKLMILEDEVTVLPGHREATTIGREREKNPFVEIWSGRREPSDESVQIAGLEEVGIKDQAASLLLWAPDYDGGNKAWVRLQDGSEAIIGGSKVLRQN